jgi:hypothetical protein
MTEPNQQSPQTGAAGRTELHDQGRFAPFTEDECCVPGDALRELLQVKQQAMEIANADLGSDPRSQFTEHDFGIPAIERMLNELEEAR